MKVTNQKKKYIYIYIYDESQIEGKIMSHLYHKYPYIHQHKQAQTQK